MTLPKLAQRNYVALLVTILLLVFVYPLLHETEHAILIYNLLRSFVFLAALPFLVSPRRYPILAGGIVVFVLGTVWVGVLLTGRGHLELTVVSHVLAITFFLVAVAVILRRVVQQRSVTFDTVAGALCAYLLVGAVFGHLYWFAEVALPGSFKGDGDFSAELADIDRSAFSLNYYSFMTLASVGTNDVVPARAAARGLTLLEAIFGQFYIAVLIADLVGKRLAQPSSEPRSNS